MDNELYLIHEDDYLRHIDHKLEMYHLLLELVRALRDDLAISSPRAGPFPMSTPRAATRMIWPS